MTQDSYRAELESYQSFKIGSDLDVFFRINSHHLKPEIVRQNLKKEMEELAEKEKLKESLPEKSQFFGKETKVRLARYETV